MGGLHRQARAPIHVQGHRAKGQPAASTDCAEASVTITTERPEGGDHDIYFNRGVAASQAYIRRFGDRPPNLVQNDQAFIWLSRGIYEAMSSFISPTSRSGTPS